MDSQKMSRPIRVTLLAVLIFSFTLFNGLRLAEAIYFWKTLLEYGTHPLYIALSGGAWLVAGLLLVWGLWQGRPWAWLGTIGGVLGYLTWYWIDRLFLQRPHSNSLYSLIATALFLFLVLLVLFSRRARWFFLREAHER